MDNFLIDVLGFEKCAFKDSEIVRDAEKLECLASLRSREHAGTFYNRRF